MLQTLLFALVIGVCIAWVWSSVFDTHGPWNSFFWFFMVIFLFAWGGESWITPLGPTAWGVAWIPIVFLGIFMALLLTASTPRSSRSRTRSTDVPHSASAARALEAEKMKVSASRDLFFFALLAVLGFIIVFDYFGHSSVH